MKDTLLQKPYGEKLYTKHETALPEGELLFEHPERQTDGEFLGTKARINEEALNKHIEEKKDVPIIINPRESKK